MNAENINGTKIQGALPSYENGAECNTTVTKPAAIATESGHWYDIITGEPRYTTSGKDGKERPSTLRDARKHGWVPSVTTITKILASDGLQAYFDRQMFDACVDEFNAHDCGHYECAQSAQYADMIFSKCRTASREHSKAAAEKGSALHGAIERNLLTNYIDTSDPYYEHVAITMDTLAQYGLNLNGSGEPEKSFAHPMGFGGKVDYHCKVQDVICDFKSKPRIVPGKRYGYDNHAMQLAAYSMGLGMPYARGINVFVGLEDKKVLIHEWSNDDLARGWNMFSLLLKFWQVSNKYFPSPEQEAA